jgi:hypothetical protein
VLHEAEDVQVGHMLACRVRAALANVSLARRDMVKHPVLSRRGWSVCCVVSAWRVLCSCHDVAGVCVVLSVRGECYAVVTRQLFPLSVMSVRSHRLHRTTLPTSAARRMPHPHPFTLRGDSLTASPTSSFSGSDDDCDLSEQRDCRDLLVPSGAV